MKVEQSNEPVPTGTVPRYEPTVKLVMSRADAVALFHAINRTLAVLDENQQAAASIPVPHLVMDAADQAAYDMANEFISQLETALQIDPDPEGLIARQRN